MGAGTAALVEGLPVGLLAGSLDGLPVGLPAGSLDGIPMVGRAMADVVINIPDTAMVAGLVRINQTPSTRFAISLAARPIAPSNRTIPTFESPKKPTKPFYETNISKLPQPSPSRSYCRAFPLLPPVWRWHGFGG